MSKSDFQAKLKFIQAIKVEEVILSKIPISEAIQEVEDLVEWCEEDKEALVHAGLDWAIVEDLPVRAGACRYAQSVWIRDSQNKEEAQKEWKIRSQEAFDLRDELLHHYTFAFRNDPYLVRKVKSIREGHSRTDMLQDLSDLAVLGKENLDLLKAVGMDQKLLTTAADTADELSVLLATANGETSDDGCSKEIRDKAYSYMKLAIDEICTTGQYVFWRDEERKKGYVSKYKKRRNDHQKKNNSQEDASLAT